MDVSVVMAVKDEEPFIGDALASILAQQGVDLELVVVDDHSSDRTAEIAGSFAEVRLLANPGCGKVAAFNHGVAQARGDWVCFFCGDDIMPAESLASRWRSARGVRADRPVIGLCRLLIMSDDPKKNGYVVPRDPRQGAWSGPCFMLDQRAVGILFPIPEHLPNEDTWLWVAGQHLDVEIVPSATIGVHWRLHSGNSITPFLPFDEFNRRYASRMKALDVFLDLHGDRLGPERQEALRQMIRCERGRLRGNLLEILMSRVELVARLRAAALSGPFLYAIRRRFYGPLSGW